MEEPKSKPREEHKPMFEHRGPRWFGRDHGDRGGFGRGKIMSQSCLKCTCTMCRPVREFKEKIQKSVKRSSKSTKSVKRSGKSTKSVKANI